MKTTILPDSEEGRLEKCTVSRPKHNWTPSATFSCLIKEPVTKTAPPARPPDSIRGGVSHTYSLAKSLFQSHKKTGSANSSTGLLISEPLSRHSPSPSLERPSSLLIQKHIAPTSVLNAEVDIPPQAVQKHSQTVPQLDISKYDLNLRPDSIGLTPSPRLQRSRVSRDLPPILESPTSAAPFLEVTLHSPRATLTGEGVGSLISMYFSRNSSTVELPPFPAAVVQRDSSVDGLPVRAPHENIGFPLKAAVSIGAVGGNKSHLHSLPPVPSVPPASPSDLTDPSQYSDSETGSPPPLPLPSLLRPTLRPTQPLRLSRTTGMNTHSLSSRDRQSMEQSRVPRKLPVPRALLTPTSRPAPLRTSSVRSFASTLAPSVSSLSRSGSNSSSQYSFF